MGILVDLSEKRREREAEKDRSKAYVPKETPVIDQDWDDPPGMYVDGIFWPLYRLGDPDGLKS